MRGEGGGVGCRRGVRKDRVSVAPGPEAVTLTDIQRQCCGSVPGSQGEPGGECGGFVLCGSRAGGEGEKASELKLKRRSSLKGDKVLLTRLPTRSSASVDLSMNARH